MTHERRSCRLVAARTQCTDVGKLQAAVELTQEASRSRARLVVVSDTVYRVHVAGAATRASIKAAPGAASSHLACTPVLCCPRAARPDKPPPKCPTRVYAAKTSSQMLGGNARDSRSPDEHRCWSPHQHRARVVPSSQAAPSTIRRALQRRSWPLACWAALDTHTYTYTAIQASQHPLTTPAAIPTLNAPRAHAAVRHPLRGAHDVACTSTPTPTDQDFVRAPHAGTRHTETHAVRRPAVAGHHHHLSP